MKNQDWERFGEDIRRTVQDAVDSQDFNRLNQTITNTVNHAMDGLEKGIHTMGDAVGDAVDKTAKNFKNQSWQNSRRQSNGQRMQAYSTEPCRIPRLFRRIPDCL